MKYRIEKIVRWEDVWALKADWNELLSSRGGGNIFLSYSWIKNWCRFSAQEVSPHFLRVREGKRTVAIIPLVFERCTWRKLPVRQLRFCIDSLSPWCGAIIPEREEEIAKVVWGFLKKQDNWDVMRMEKIPEGEMGFLFQSMAPGQGLDSLIAHGSQYYIAIDGTWESYCLTRTKRFRRRLRTLAENSGEGGNSAEVRIFDTPETAQEGMRMFLDVDSRSWKREEGETIDLGSTLHGYYQNIVDTFTAKGQCFLVAFMSAGKPVSAAIFLCDKQGAYGFKTSFAADCGLEDISPGFIVVAAGIRECWRRGSKVIHLLSGSPEWERWTSKKKGFARRVVFRPSPYGDLLLGVERSIRLFAGKRIWYAFVPRVAEGTQETVPSEDRC